MPDYKAYKNSDGSYDIHEQLSGGNELEGCIILAFPILAGVASWKVFGLATVESKLLFLAAIVIGGAIGFRFSEILAKVISAILVLGLLAWWLFS